MSQLFAGDISPLDSQFETIKANFQQLLISCQNDRDRLTDIIFIEIEEVVHTYFDPSLPTLLKISIEQMGLIIDEIYYRRLEQLKDVILGPQIPNQLFSKRIQDFIFETVGEVLHQLETHAIGGPISVEREIKKEL